MTSIETSSNETPPVSRWRLWVDGCGGFLLLTGNRWTVGGYDPSSTADICVRADWPRRAGTIHRDSADYFWQDATSDQAAETNRQLLTNGKALPISGSARMTLNCPNPLSTSATLHLRGPHRFDGHVDAAILVNETLLVGPESDCHIRASEFPDRAVLVCRAGRWQAKLAGENAFCELPVGERIMLESLAMTLEAA